MSPRSMASPIRRAAMTFGCSDIGSFLPGGLDALVWRWDAARPCRSSDYAPTRRLRPEIRPTYPHPSGAFGGTVPAGPAPRTLRGLRVEPLPPAKEAIDGHVRRTRPPDRRGSEGLCRRARPGHG